MDFERVLGLVAGFFAERDRPWALIGGLAMVAYGLGRTTLDVDVLVSSSDQARFITFLESLGYETCHCSRGFSNHRHADQDLGCVDAVYVRGESEQRMFAGLRQVAGPGRRLIPVPRPEHLAAMKIFSIRNEPRRVGRELDDVRFLMGLDGVDRDQVLGAFRRYGLEELIERIE
jgi:hypothetical protein